MYVGLGFCHARMAERNCKTITPHDSISIYLFEECRVVTDVASKFVTLQRTVLGAVRIGQVAFLHCKKKYTSDELKNAHF